MLALLHIITWEHQITKDKASDIVLKLLEKTNDPVEFMRLIEAEF